MSGSCVHARSQLKQEAGHAVQVLCSPAPQSSQLQEEEVRPHKPAAREEEDQVEQLSATERICSSTSSRGCIELVWSYRVHESIRRDLAAKDVIDALQLSALVTLHRKHMEMHSRFTDTACDITKDPGCMGRLLLEMTDFCLPVYTANLVVSKIEVHHCVRHRHQLIIDAIVSPTICRECFREVLTTLPARQA